MGADLRLADISKNLSEFDQDATIYAAKPWNAQSFAVVALEPESGGLPELASVSGFEYFLEVFIATEVLADWEASLGRVPTDHERCERLIEYAVNDA